MIQSMKTKKAPRRGFRPDLEVVEQKMVLSTLFANPLALDGAAGSLRAAITTANNENSNVVNILAAPGTYTLTEGVMEVDGGRITISSTGVGKVNIVAKGGSSIFDLESGTLTVNNLGFSNGNNSDSEEGGAIYVASGATLNVNASSFTNNYASDYGGAIYNDGILNVNASTFTNNNGYDYGGAIYNDNYAVIANSTFTSNTSEYGGAIYSEGPSGDAIVANPNVVPTIASANLVVTNSSFIGNVGYYYGGAIYGEDIETITGSTFTGNSTAEDEGGALYNDDSMFITASTFTGNKASDDDGGAIYNDETMTILGSTFTSNTSIYDEGGAVYNDGSLLINASSFTGNTANDDDGGAIYNDDSLSIRYSTFTNNQANDGDGGAIYNYGTLSVVGGVFKSNYASDGGSAIENYYDSTATISASTFTGNSTYEAEGFTIDTDEMCGEGPTVTMTNCLVTANDNGVYVDEDSTLNLNGCIISGNVYESLSNYGTANISLTMMGATDGTGVFNHL